MAIEKVTFDVKLDDDQMLQKVEEIVTRFETKRGAAIPILQSIQTEFGYVPKPSLKKVSSLTGIPASDLFSIVTFYAQFRLQPIGDNLIQVCHGTACHLAGAEEITGALLRAAKIQEGNTSPDRKFTIEKVACLGCCSLAPVLTINGETFGKLTPESAVRLLKKI
ncbi:NADH-quinone oxidoreductase subunit NuoE [Desulfitibacter alkalitolerans]|uniref:NADH-quinone oxidoreductase subunit NuoE n=1 Tax=Desulfitibacter alkalitolerans TaxID=264641 RepID=UPI0006888E08|nr:NADH-quinone oxidoreductase subunit NuoE [Desulfitibacter alkalitolerans]